jgi:hypothetical protein
MITGKISYLTACIASFVATGAMAMIFCGSNDPAWWIVFCTVYPAVSLAGSAIARKADDWPKNQSQKIALIP